MPNSIHACDLAVIMKIKTLFIARWKHFDSDGSAMVKYTQKVVIIKNLLRNKVLRAEGIGVFMPS